MGRLQNRLQLHELLVDLLGSTNVYFQPPANIAMKFPCIVYQRNGDSPTYADNSTYRNTQRYQVTHIGADPDSDMPDKIAQLPLCSFDRFYEADNLNHDVYSLFF